MVFFTTIVELIFGIRPLSLVAQFVFFTAIALLYMWYHMQRVGGLRAIAVISYPRLFLGIFLCNSIYIIDYHIKLSVYHLLQISFPTYAWLGLIIYILVEKTRIGSRLFSGHVTTYGMQIDGGKALRVITSRFKTEVDSHPGWIDLSEDYGAHAQFIPRGAIGADRTTQPLALIAAGIIVVAQAIIMILGWLVPYLFK